MKFLEKFKKKGQMMTGAINTLLTLGIGVMVLSIALAFGQDITGDIKDDFTSGSLEYNATQDGQLAMANITEKAPTVSKVGVAVVIIGLIVGGFGVYFSRR